MGTATRTVHRHGEGSRWALMASLLTRAQLQPGLVNGAAVAECDAMIASEGEPAWRARWLYTRAAAEMSGDDLEAARITIDVLVDEATRSAVPALVTLAHAMRSWLHGLFEEIDQAVEQVGQAVAVAEAGDHRLDVEDWSSAFLVIGRRSP
jgi:hypothetical protein